MNLVYLLSNICKYLAFSFLLTFVIISKSQNGILVFEKPNVDLGNIKLNDITNHKFFYKSTKKQPLKIEKVLPDCACTIINYSKELISLEDSGFIEVTYEPYKSGHFVKSITVITNSTPKKIELSIKGFVEPMYIMPQVEFPVLKGNLRLRNKVINLGIVSNNEMIKKNIDIYNDAAYPIYIKQKILSPEYITVDFHKKNFIIPPKQKGSIILYYNTKKLNDFGYFIDTLSFFTDDTLSRSLKILVRAIVKQYFPNKNEIDDKSLPQLNVYPEAFNLGTISLKNKKTLLFKITNVGRSKLIIHKIISNYGCKIGKLKNNIILPNESKQVSISVYDTGKKGIQERSFSLFTNDPKNSIKKVVIKSKVVHR